jgi:ATP-binding cassette, subfamily F, member 3
MIVIENLTKQFGDHILFEDANFQINSRERVGLVGRNGHGKTTLFRILIGKESYDNGSVAIPKHYRIGYVAQQIVFSADTVLEEAMKGLPQQERDHSWKVEKVLSGLGFSENDLQSHPDNFSAGYQERLNLAKVLVSDPDLLLLDEPTNYLDITSIRWVEEFLQRWPRELILITHDRSFMDKVVTHTMGIHRRKIRKIPGNTEKYYDQLALDEGIYEKTRLKDERRRKEIDQFITRFRAKARLANLVQSRIKTLSKMEKRERLEGIKTLDFSFRSRPFEGRQVLSVEDLSFSYQPNGSLIEHFSVTVRAGDRLCVVGKNGKGKTTLLKLLSGTLSPKKGRLRYNPNVVSGIFEQSNVARLVDSRTVEEEILNAHPDVSRQLARNICGAMMFEGDDALKKIGVLSGGEKSRVMLGNILATPVNLLMLDEPTNHLDMESCDALLAAIDSFEGAVIMVTHNEMLLHALAERLVVFQHNRIDVFDGSYQRFLEAVGWEDEKPPAGGKASNENGLKEKLSKKEMRRLKSEVITERSKTLKPLENRIHGIEQEIETNEKKLEALDHDMVSASEVQNGERIVEISQTIHACHKAVDRLFNELEIVTRELDEKKIEFDERLKQLDQLHIA